MTEKRMLLEDNNNKKKTPRKRFLIGITGAFGCAFAIIAGIACIQLMDQIPPDFELNIFRFTIGLISAVFYLSAKQKLPWIDRSNIKWMLAVSFFGLCYNVFIYNHFLKSITFVGIQSIQKAMTITFSLILSKIFLKVKISAAKGISVVAVLCALGLILAAQYVEDRSCVVETKERMEMADVTTPLEEINDLHSNTTVGLNSSINKLTKTDICVPTSRFVLGIMLLSLGAFAACLDALTVSGTTLSQENIVVVSFWEFVVGIAVSLVISLVFERLIFPNNVKDILLLIGHGVSASSITYLEIVAVQNIDMNLYYITTSVIFPVSLLLHLTVLHNVSPNANLTMLTTGMMVIFVCALFLPVYEYFGIDKAKSQSNDGE